MKEIATFLISTWVQDVRKAPGLGQGMSTFRIGRPTAAIAQQSPISYAEDSERHEGQPQRTVGNLEPNSTSTSSFGSSRQPLESNPCELMGLDPE